MTEHPKRLWSSLTERLSQLPDDVAVREYGSALVEWVSMNRTKIGSDILARYGLDWLATISLDEFPVENADLSVMVERTSLSHQEPSSAEVVAMLVRDQLWNLIAFKTNIECPSCKEDELRTLVGPDNDDELVLACDFCGWAQDEYGQPWKGRPDCRPAKTSKLRERRLL